MPIINRIDMLTTGIRSEVGVKVFGSDLAVLETLARRVADVVRDRAGRGERLSRAADERPVPEHPRGPRRRRSLRPERRRRPGDDRVRDRRNAGRARRSRAGSASRSACGSPSAFRADPQAIGETLVVTPSGQQVPLRCVADDRACARARDDLVGERAAASRPCCSTCRAATSAASCATPRRRRRARRAARRVLHRLERALREPGTRAARLLRRAADRARRHLCPAVLHVSLGDRGGARAARRAVRADGRRVLVWLLGYNFSVAVWVGFIALFGTAVQTAVVMVIYLEEAVRRRPPTARSRGPRCARP